MSFIQLMAGKTSDQTLITPAGGDPPFRLMVEASRDLIWAVDKEGRWTYLNHAAEEIYGYQLSEMLGRPFTDFEPPDVQKKDLEAFQDILGGNPYFKYVTEHIRKDGSRIYLSFNAVALRNDSGEIIGTTGTASDITERVRAENALRSVVVGTATSTAENFFPSLAKHLANALEVKFAMVGELLEDKPKIVRTLAFWDGSSFVPQIEYNLKGTPCEIVSSGKACFYPSGVQQAFPSDHLLVEMGIESYRGTPLLDSEGSPIGILVVLDTKPMSESTMGADILNIFGARTGAELERIRAGKAALALQSQIIQMQKMDAIGKLSAGIAHDLNNALGSISGHLMLLSNSQSLTDEDKRSLKIALKGCQHSSSLINRLLLFSRKEKLKLENIELRQAVSDSVDLLSSIMSGNISLTISPSNAGFFVEGDQAQIQQALTNLLINAEQSINGKGQISISIEQEYIATPTTFNPKAREGDYITISVKDSGSGIKPEDLSKIFDPFYTTKADLGGTGLGLSVVYGIMQAHQGWITVDSRPGLGATFKLYFPKAKEKLQETIGNASENRRPGTILVIDDEPFLVDLLLEFLRLAGYHGMGFVSGRQALDWYKENHRDVSLVFLDMRMPVMGGTEILKQLREITPTLLVAVCSGYTSDQQIAELRGLGITEFFKKPLAYPAIINWVRKTLGSPVEIASNG